MNRHLSLINQYYRDEENLVLFSKQPDNPDSIHNNKWREIKQAHWKDHVDYFVAHKKHAGFVLDWLNKGKPPIQMSVTGVEWSDVNSAISFSPDFKYRIKPKPQMVQESRWIGVPNAQGNALGVTPEYEALTTVDPILLPQHELFDWHKVTIQVTKEV